MGLRRPNGPWHCRLGSRPRHPVRSAVSVLAVLLAVASCSGSSSTADVEASTIATPEVGTVSSPATAPGATQRATTELSGTSLAPSPPSDDPGVPFAEHGQAALIFSTPTPLRDGVILHNVVADPSAYDIVEPVIPFPVWAPLFRLDEAGTRLYAFVFFSLRGCDLPVPVQVDVTADTVSITIATGRDRRAVGGCDDGSTAGYLLPIAVPGGVGERTIVQTACVAHASCSDTRDTLDELPLVRSQLVGCVPESLTSWATPEIFELDVCDDLTLAEDYNGLAPYT